jgi:hypothetical protein
MVIRLLPAPVDPATSTGATTGSTGSATTNPVILNARVTTRGGASSSNDFYVRSGSTGRGADRVRTTLPQSSWTGDSAYVSGTSWDGSAPSSIAAHYLTYAGLAAGDNGQLIDVYA